MLKNLFFSFWVFTHIQLEIKFTFFLKEKGLGSPKNNDNNELVNYAEKNEDHEIR